MARIRVPKLLAILVTAVTILLGSAVQANAASPAPVAPVPTHPVTEYVGGINRTTTTGPDAITPSLTPAIVCHLTVDYPHNSKHILGTINVVSTISCTGLVPDKLSLMTTLYKIVCDPYCHDIAYGSAGSNVNYGSSSLSGNSATKSCTPGDYFGVASGVVTAPANVTPRIGNLEATGPTKPITC